MYFEGLLASMAYAKLDKGNVVLIPFGDFIF